MLPKFIYHPDPVATGNVEVSDIVCRSCGQSRGHIYTGPVYAVEELSNAICPWCIADGSAAMMFEASFSDAESLVGKVPKEVGLEIAQRTPGFISWQQGGWLACCEDACEFHGDAPPEELRAISLEALEGRLEPELDKDDWKQIVKRYEPGGSPAFYKFVCRKCRQTRYGWDCD